MATLASDCSTGHGGSSPFGRFGREFRVLEVGRSIPGVDVAEGVLDGGSAECAWRGACAPIRSLHGIDHGLSVLPRP